jgi:hypothetical protein
MRLGAWIAVSVLTAIPGVCLTSSRGASQDAAQSSPPVADALTAHDLIASVLQDPRCLNCRPRADRPTQGDDRHIHGMNVQRGVDGTGTPAMRWSTCHQEHNNDTAGIPGAPHWHLAPASMDWVGPEQGRLCRTLLDRTKNGGRSVADLIAHMTGDILDHQHLPAAGPTRASSRRSWRRPDRLDGPREAVQKPPG